MKRSPGFTAVAVLSVVLGITANITIFSLMNGVLLRPLPGKNPGELVTIYTSDYSGPLYGASSYPDFMDFQQKSEVFDGLAAYAMEPMLLTQAGGNEGVRVFGQMVSGNYFEVLGITAILGRTFMTGESTSDRPAPVVILGNHTWQRQFGGDPDIIGKSLQLNGQNFSVIGVTPEGFHGLMRGLRTDVWVPLGIMPHLTGRPNLLQERSNRGLSLFGRRKPGLSVDQVRANITVIAEQLYESYPQDWRNRHGDPRVVTVLPESSSRVAPVAAEPVKLFLALLLVVVGLVLLIACSNVANMMLARGSARRKEIAIRLSQGAGRGRIVRQLLTESLLLAGIAGAVAGLLAMATTRLLEAFQPPLPVSLSLDLSPDWRVLVFAACLALVTGILFGLAPALRATRPDILSALKGDSGADRHGRSLFRWGLVIGQVAISVLLLVGAGLLLRSMGNANAIDPGFDPDNVLLASIDLDSRGYPETRGRVFFADLQERIGRLPGVEEVSITDRLPLGLDWQRRSMTAEGQQPAPGEDMEHHYATVDSGFFRVMKMPLLKGRSFSPTDEAGAAGVVIVSEAFARKFWPRQEPLGKWLVLGGYRDGVPSSAQRWTVIGVAGNAKYNSLSEDETPFVYFPHRQEYTGAMTLLIRTKEDPGVMASAVRENLKAMDEAIPIYGVTTLDQYIGTSLVPVRMAAVLLGIMASLALILAGVGIYGVLAYEVSRRTSEIGIRMALGAQRTNILRMVLRQALVMTGIGSIIGLIAAAGMTRFASFLLYGISPLDPQIFGAVPLLMTGLALLASLMPSLRATRVTPMEALRYE
jgi:predicted permease